MGMTKLTAEFEIVTPLFMGGANPQSSELRVPSIKGVLRSHLVCLTCQDLPLKEW
jgi:CRISPR/Cas system CMR-associated protein Cmr1 (group 7 of RAMP superfamily)